MSENLFGLTVAADKGLDDLQCQRLLSENRRYQEVMLQYRCALKALESRLEILNEEFSLQHDRNPIESMKSRLKSPSSIMRQIQKDKHPFLMLVLLYSVTSSRSVSAPLRLLFASQIGIRATCRFRISARYSPLSMMPYSCFA